MKIFFGNHQQNYESHNSRLFMDGRKDQQQKGAKQFAVDSTLLLAVIVNILINGVAVIAEARPQGVN